MTDETDVRSITTAEAKSGVEACAGRPLVLLIEDSRAPAGSSTAATAASKSTPELREARWTRDNLHPGEEAVAEVVVAGGEGATVHFIIERGSGGQWSEHSRVTGRVSGGKAMVTVATPGTEDGLELRFHCELA